MAVPTFDIEVLPGIRAKGRMTSADLDAKEATFDVQLEYRWWQVPISLMRYAYQEHDFGLRHAPLVALSAIKTTVHMWRNMREYDVEVP